MRIAKVIVVSCGILLALGAPAWATGLTIIPTFDSSVTSSPSAAGYEADVNAAVALYGSLFSNPVTVNILFRYSATDATGAALGGIGASESALYIGPWNTYTSALTANL